MVCVGGGRGRAEGSTFVQCKDISHTAGNPGPLLGDARHGDDSELDPALEGMPVWWRRQLCKQRFLGLREETLGSGLLDQFEDVPTQLGSQRGLPGGGDVLEELARVRAGMQRGHPIKACPGQSGKYRWIDMEASMVRHRGVWGWGAGL